MVLRSAGLIQTEQGMFLRQVEEKDCDLVFRWANDDQVRMNSFSCAEICYGDHIEWFNRKLNESERYFYILVHNGFDVGLIRLDVEDQKGRISYSISKDFRGKGYGSTIILMLEEKLKGCGSIEKLCGEVKYSNKASQKIFKKLGFKEHAMQDKLVYEKDLPR